MNPTPRGHQPHVEKENFQWGWEKDVLFKAFLISQLCQIQPSLLFLLGEVILKRKKQEKSTCMIKSGKYSFGGEDCSLGDLPGLEQVGGEVPGCACMQGGHTLFTHTPPPNTQSQTVLLRLLHLSCGSRLIL